MISPDQRIIKLIKKHHVLTLATSKDNLPWVASCFYAWLEDENAFVYTTDLKTRHGAEAEVNKQVAANIYLETKVVGKIRGIQIAGATIRPEGDLLEKARKRYLKRFPYARLMETTLWVLNPTEMKMTDNRLGFGKKLIWTAEKGSTIT